MRMPQVIIPGSRFSLLNIHFLGGMKGDQFMTVSNGLTEDLFVQIEPVNLVHQTERADRQFAIGASPVEASFEVN